MNDYQQLRTLLLAEEQQRIDKLEQRIIDLQSRSQDVASVLPQALKIVPDMSELIIALQKPVDNCVKKTIQIEPESFANPLHPLLIEPLRIEVAQLVKKIRKILHSHKIHISTLDAELDQLEQQQIQTILRRIVQLETDLKDTEKRTAEIAKSLPDAIRRASEQDGTKTEISDAELAESLQIPVTRCIQQSISQDAKALADTLFPIMGPAIRRAINESIKEFLQSVNAAVEQSLSIKGMLWRFEALRTGQSFTDVLLQKTLVYRVEQVFLVHKESGLLIQHLSQDGVEVGDSDAVSAMLTAIQDFIRDSFTAEGDLEKVELGNYTVWLEQGPYAVLACVVRGNASYKLRGVMKQSLETIHARYGRLLAHFEGDPAPLEPCHAILQKNLQMKELKQEASKKSRFFSLPLIAVTSLIVIGIFTWLFLQIQHQRHLQHYIQTLRNTAGLMVINTKQDNGKLIVRGLRDPLATDPAEITAQFALQDKIVNEWGTYQDLAPQFVLQRAKQALNPPDSVNISLKNNKLYLTGEADNEWIEQAILKQGMLGGIQQVIMDELHNRQQYWLDTKQQFLALVDTLDSVQGIKITKVDKRDNKRIIKGLRDPLSIDPQKIAQQFNLADVEMEWAQYHALYPQFILQRAKQALNPPDNISITFADGTLFITGVAEHEWIEQLQLKQSMLIGVADVDTTNLTNKKQYWIDTQPLFTKLLAALDEAAGLKVIASGIENDHYFIKGLRDPLAPQPNEIADKIGLENVVMQWTAYQDLHPNFVLQRAKFALQPPETIELNLKHDLLIIKGDADNDWIEELRLKQGMLAGIKKFDTTELYNQQQYWIDTESAFQNLLAELDTIDGIKILDAGIKNNQRFIKGLKDPLAQNPQSILDATGLRVIANWQAYHDLSPNFVLQRAKQALNPPDTVKLDISAQTLIFTGHAPQAWIDSAVKISTTLAGVAKLNLEQLQNNGDWLWAKIADKLPNWVDVDFTIRDEQLYISGLATQAMRDDLQQRLAKLNIANYTNALRDAEQEDLQHQIDLYIAALRQTVGLSVTDIKKIADKTIIYGLRDPLAIRPDRLAADYGLSSDQLKMYWTSYQDLHPSFIEKRALQALEPPATVQLHLETDTLHLNGHAPGVWIEKALNNVFLINGINHLNADNLQNTDQVLLKQAQATLNLPDGVSLEVKDKRLYVLGIITDQARKQLMNKLAILQDFAEIDTENLLDATIEQRKEVIAKIENTAIYFADDKSFAPDQEQILRDLITNIRLLLRFNKQLNQPLRIQLTGYTDGIGTLDYNRQLGQERVETVRNWLQTQGITSDYLLLTQSSLIRFGETTNNHQDRKVTFKIVK